ncbi:deoxyhypusine synthase [Ignavibacteria bacterium CHB1]|nr:MAG: deoxyhypusine synthase [Chlorobiota bacterium]MBV6398229.1 Deoxyhypusine synthase-like protein [Ignavibacteria bacterium]MCC6885857.1 deoxyhypusine synthase [Ignavibacteriales bacterium]MCE7953485.1 deoxyhypusine synthase [Chlorobi bacterium CHB7]MDL1887421.1 deoxyhypusine synthase [Ignavibacteria bacterium CHB1]RIK48650.1 MAG: deoxyhypusine synthase [Ignavibacteriota bacterium]
MATKKDYLREEIRHIDIKSLDVSHLIDAYRDMAFSARDLARAADYYNMMLEDKNCSVMLCLAGSLFSAGLKDVVVDMIRNNMVDVIISTGAIMVDQDFFEGLGFKHYKGTKFVDDNELRELMIDRIYDTFIDEENLRDCDMTIANICESLEKRPYSSREFIWHMGKYLSEFGKNPNSVVLAAYENNVPIFVPAFSDCSAGFGFVHHQYHNPDKHVSLDSARDFLELTQIKLHTNESGLYMVGGGVPKNFTQDVVVAADILEKEVPMHKYAIQITVADERDGALSGSTLKEASSWGKVDMTYEQMVYCEATIAMPIISAFAYQTGHWKNREKREFHKLFQKEKVEL